MSNRERQENELLALTSIYSSEELSTVDISRPSEIGSDELGGTFVAELYFTPELIVTTAIEGKRHSVRHLPPLFLSFAMPNSYPSHRPPQFTIVSAWLNESQVSKLSSHLMELWKLNEGSEILFVWTDFLQRDSVEFLNVTSPLVLSPYEFQISVEFDSAKRRLDFEKSASTCGICYESKLGLLCTIFLPCEHVFCRDCVKTEFDMKIREGNVGALNCPFHPCESKADHAQVKNLVSAELFERYDKLLLQNSLDKMSDVQYCPGRGCSYPVLVDRDAGLGMCPNCKYVFCVYCKKASHGISSCQNKTEAMKQILDEYEKSDSAGRKALTRHYGKRVIASVLDEMSQKWIQDNSKLCPECKCKIEKTGGCHNMYCTKCNIYFCWLCLEVLQKESSYAHFSNKASPCYNKLFFGVENEEPVFEEEDFVEAWNQEAEEGGWDENWTEGMEDAFLDDPEIFNVLQSLE